MLGAANACGSFIAALAAEQIKVLKGLDESLARFYVGSIVLALEYLHEHSIGMGSGQSMAPLGTSTAYLWDMGMAWH